MEITVLIPAFNEELNIKETLKDVVAVLDTLNLKSYEIIVIDDHSTDDTFDRVVSFNNPRVECIRLSNRRGSHIAMRAGLSEARGKAVFGMAADGQDDPATLGLMLAQWQKGYQVVWACRQSRQLERLSYRFITALFYNFLAFCCKYSKEEKELMNKADFFLLDRLVVDALNACRENQTAVFGLILWGGFKQTSIEYTRKSRRSGQSKWNFKKRVSLAKDWILAFSALPVHLVFLMGVWIAILAAIYLFWTLINAGHWSLIGTVFFMGGLQLAAIGVVGEYMWCALKETRSRPLYFIEQRSGSALK